MITTKNFGLLYPFFFATYMVLFDTCNYCLVFICISQAHNEPKYVKAVIHIGPNSERYTYEHKHITFFLRHKNITNVPNECNNNIKLFTKLVCRSLSYIAMIKNIDFLVQLNCKIHVHIFAVYSCPRLHFIDSTNINKAKHFFHNFFQRAPILILKRI